MNDLGAWIGLVRFQKFGPKGLARLALRFSDMNQAFEASASDFLDVGIKPEIANRFLQERAHIDRDRESELVQKHNISVITINDELYPKSLKEIYDPPAVLFVKGTLPLSSKKHVAVVGSRKASAYGRRVVQDLIGPLAKTDSVIVSGLAYGVDSMAHVTTIESKGTTVAVLGSGLDDDNIYPSQNRTLASRIIASGGAIISEFPVGTPPLGYHFPMRNRIIAGLCDSTIVVEAAKKSGSLITARLALEHNRDVFAVPGPIHAPLSFGPNLLIKDGAIPLTCVEDLIGQTQQKKRKEHTYEPSTEEESVIFDLLSSVPMHVDEIITQSKLPATKVLQTISLMEMKGGAEDQGGRHFINAA